MGPPSSGGSTVGEALNILEGYNLASMPRDLAFHYFLEASRYSFADRNAYLADPDYFDVPLKGLLSKDYAATRRALITTTAANPPVVAPGDPSPYVKGKASTGSSAETTTHLVTSDKKGNVVSYTFTIESTGGSGLLVPGYGFLLNNELTDFNFTPPSPNLPDGGKRPRSSMAPTIVLKHNKPFLALGSPGGATIITTVLQILFDRLDEGWTLPQAIADPRASQRNATATGDEPAFHSTPLRTQLEARGHQFANAGEIGAATGIEFLAGGKLLAAAEPVRRGTGSALVVKPGALVQAHRAVVGRDGARPTGHAELRLVLASEAPRVVPARRDVLAPQLLVHLRVERRLVPAAVLHDDRELEPLRVVRLRRDAAERDASAPASDSRRRIDASRR